jgi:hypothetical protein
MLQKKDNPLLVLALLLSLLYPAKPSSAETYTSIDRSSSVPSVTNRVDRQTSNNIQLENSIESPQTEIIAQATETPAADTNNSDSGSGSKLWLWIVVSIPIIIGGIFLYKSMFGGSPGAGIESSSSDTPLPTPNDDNNILDNATETVSNLAQNATETVSNLAEQAQNAGGAAIAGGAAMAAGAAAAAASLFDRDGQPPETQGTDTASLLDNFVGDISESTNNLTQGANDAVSNLTEQVTGGGNPLENLMGNASEQASNLTQGASDAVSNLTEQVTGGGNPLENLMGNATETVSNLTEQVTGGGNPLENLMGNATETVSNLTEQVTGGDTGNPFENLASNVSDVTGNAEDGSNPLESLFQGAGEKIEELKNNFAGGDTATVEDNELEAFLSNASDKIGEVQESSTNFLDDLWTQVTGKEGQEEIASNINESQQKDDGNLEDLFKDLYSDDK